jgi:hypothetical protein
MNKTLLHWLVAEKVAITERNLIGRSMPFLLVVLGQSKKVYGQLEISGDSWNGVYWRENEGQGLIFMGIDKENGDRWGERGCFGVKCL